VRGGATGCGADVSSLRRRALDRAHHRTRLSVGTRCWQRKPGVIAIDDTNVNQEMVSGGWAWHYRQYSSDQTLVWLESQAKSAGSGLWADAKPLPAWEFRARQRSGSGSGERPSKSSNGTCHPASSRRGAVPTNVSPQMLDSTRKVCSFLPCLHSSICGKRICRIYVRLPGHLDDLRPSPPIQTDQMKPQTKLHLGL